MPVCKSLTSGGTRVRICLNNGGTLLHIEEQAECNFMRAGPTTQAFLTLGEREEKPKGSTGTHSTGGH
jgi:hypothetical protein